MSDLSRSTDSIAEEFGRSKRLASSGDEVALCKMSSAAEVDMRSIRTLMFLTFLDVLFKENFWSARSRLDF